VSKNSLTSSGQKWELSCAREEKKKILGVWAYKDDRTDLTCLLVRSPKGSRIDKHEHKNSDDIIFVIKGKATMWIDGLGDSPMVPGSFFRIPKGVRHHPHDIEEDLLIYDVFYPYLA
jgi:quercetin dioxygenase-like cupin family protein